MCFSAPASFTSGTILTLSGVYSLRQARQKRVLPFAVIPLLFGIQQLTEGVIWSSFAAPALNALATQTYLIFAYSLWPALIPSTFYLLETEKKRKQYLVPFMALGVVLGLYLLWHTLSFPYVAQVVCNSIGYFGSHKYFPFVAPVYLTVICGSALISSRKLINLLGLAIAATACVAAWFYTYSYVSTWCFFAAILSVLVIVQVRKEQGRNPKNL